MESKKYHAPAACPVCGDHVTITRVKCSRCGSEISGDFSPCKFCSLEDKHLQFVATFLRCRGSIKEVEKALGVSYPTVRNMMDAALSALGLQEPAPNISEEDKEKSKIIEKLSTKEIDVEMAIDALQKLKGDNQT